MKNISRRSLIQAGSAVFAGWASAPAFSRPSGRKLGVALVGLGGYSTHRLAPGLMLTEHCELRGIVTGTPGKIPQWQAQYGIPDKNVYSYDTMHEMANNSDIDVAYIVVPTGLHMKYAVRAAEAGKHVWCEKPMAMSVQECETIIEACKKNKVFLSVGYRLHHEPNTQTIMRFAEEKPYGEISAMDVVAAYAGSGLPEDNWRMQKAMGGGALYDMGVYPINGARYGSGMEPIAVSARIEKSHPDIFKEVDETTYFKLKFPNDMVADCMTSVVKPGNHLKVQCAQGSYYLEPMSQYSGVSGATSDGILLNKKIVHQQAAQMDDDAFAILNGQPAIVPGEEGLRDIKIVEAAFASAAKSGAWVNLA